MRSYYCAACKTASLKADWESVKELPVPTYICPNCGGYFKIDIVNAEEEEPEVIAEKVAPAKPKAPAKKKPTPKKKTP
jgi:C4-type Zn-finger protein